MASIRAGWWRVRSLRPATHEDLCRDGRRLGVATIALSAVEVVVLVLTLVVIVPDEELLGLTAVLSGFALVASALLLVVRSDSGHGSFTQSRLGIGISLDDEDVSELLRGASQRMRRWSIACAAGGGAVFVAAGLRHLVPPKVVDVGQGRCAQVGHDGAVRYFTHGQCQAFDMADLRLAVAAALVCTLIAGILVSGIRRLEIDRR